MGHWGCSSHGDRRARWQQRFADKWEQGRGEMRRGGFASSGNRAFDDYREATLKRLEDEQREFREYLERLRLAKDRSEFDQFVADRKSRPATQGSGTPENPAGENTPTPQT